MHVTFWLSINTWAVLFEDLYLQQGMVQTYDKNAITGRSSALRQRPRSAHFGMKAEPLAKATQYQLQEEVCTSGKNRVVYILGRKQCFWQKPRSISIRKEQRI
jgi:hypothetical protein